MRTKFKASTIGYMMDGRKSGRKPRFLEVGIVLDILTKCK
jgi:hypothetical protein